jgi:hypothetical protein
VFCNIYGGFFSPSHGGVSVATLHKIAKALQVEINELTEDEEE